MKFITTPTLAILGMVRYPLPKTMALGGVATGSIKAQEADIVAGIISMKGCTLTAKEVAAKIGIKVVAVAVLEVTSVKKVISRETNKTMPNTGTAPNPFKLPPIQPANPV